MNAIVFYVAGTVAVALLISTVLILLDVSEMPKSTIPASLLLAAFFAGVAWFAAFDIGEAGE
ncbi:hypothetical protein M1D96_06435 [Pseudomonas sp. D1-3]